MYLEIVIIILLIVLTYSSCCQHKIQEGLVTNSVSSMNTTTQNSGSNIQNYPNSIVMNSTNSGIVPNVISSNTVSTDNTGSNTNYLVTSSTDNLDSSGNNSSPGCDPSTLFSMKNIIRDENGNIIVRYIDTCGKYYTYEYTQSLNHIQYPSTTSSQVGVTQQPVVIKEVPAATTAPQTDAYTKLQNAIVNKSLDLLSKVDANTINGMISSVVTNMQNYSPSSYNTVTTNPPFSDYTQPPQENIVQPVTSDQPTFDPNAPTEQVNGNANYQSSFNIEASGSSS